MVRNISKQHNSSLVPPYYEVLEEKKKCYPPGILVTHKSAEALLDNDSKRLVEFLDRAETVYPPCQTLQCHFEHNWGVDGSGKHSIYKQAFLDDTSDENILLTAIWVNSSPSSTQFCKALRLQMLMGSEETILEEELYISRQIQALRPSVVQSRTGVELMICHSLKLTMVDGKVRGYLTDTSFSNGAKPSDMFCKFLQKRPINKDVLKYGLPVLHAQIRMLECVMNITYRLEIKKWSVNVSLYKARKEKTQNALREKLGILVDFVKVGSGSTNDGNTARTFFKNVELVSSVTEVDKGLFQRFADIQCVLSSGLPINIIDFKEYCKATILRYERRYPWFYMPSSIHVILMHGGDIISSLDIPLGAYSEEAFESKNKFVPSFREFRTRKFLREATMEDLFNRLLVSGLVEFGFLD
ncbi:hypothetical protein FOCC_FOCC014237 [Frankliniella occidentalis]|nr:hypothetical protein FOCC_FOCC014237 [Frankliniella occidentalis]